MKTIKKRRTLMAVLLTAVLVISVTGTVLASHSEASLAGSNFEIDEDANLKVDDAAPSIDWAGVNEVRAIDKVNGTGDNSYAGGVKEDTVCPKETTDSIPPNKSDLLSFHVYKEAGTGGHPGFLNLGWGRVSDPSGTTLMDFEFNQSEVNCVGSPNKERTPGDLLIEYAIDQGGARANITVRYWDGAAWDPAMDLDAPSPLCGGEPCAAGTINSSPIAAAESDGLIDSGSKQARTFGEAQIDLRLIFQSDKCVSFGSATLKSRSSDSFTSQLKDFVSPVGINLQNCGSVIIRKETNPEENPNVTSFDFTKAFATDPATSDTFSLTDDGSQSFDNVLFGSGYTVTEDNIPAGWILENLDCSASTGVSANINGATVTFDIDSADDTLDFTYTNKKQVGAILVTKTYKHAASGSGDHPQAGVSFTVNGVTKATDVNGQACFDGLLFGNYTVTETVPSGYVADNPPGASQDVIVSVTSDCGDGNEAQVSFRNTPLTDLTVSVNSQVDGGTASTFTCVDENGLTIGTGSTGANGDGSLTVNDLLPGTYTCTMVIDP